MEDISLNNSKQVIFPLNIWQTVPQGGTLSRPRWLSLKVMALTPEEGILNSRNIIVNRGKCVKLAYRATVVEDQIPLKIHLFYYNVHYYTQVCILKSI